MDWWNLLLFAAGALAGYGFRPKGKQESRSQDTITSSRASASDRSNLLHAYSRELSNYLIQLNPERYYTAYSNSVFYGDEIGDVHESFYRTDRKFEKREVLHVL
jgi:hypothetical protein